MGIHMCFQSTWAVGNSDCEVNSDNTQIGTHRGNIFLQTSHPCILDFFFFSAGIESLGSDDDVAKSGYM